MTDARLPGQATLYSLEAEQCVLGCILINPDSFTEVSLFLKPENFYIHKHRWIWEAVAHLAYKNSPIDFVTISEELDRRHQLEDVGGAAYLTQLINTIPTSLHAEAYGWIVHTDALRRKMMEAATAIAKLAYEEGREIGEVLADAESKIFSIRAQSVSVKDAPTRAPEIVETVHSQLTDRDNLQKRLVPTGLAPVDASYGGGMERKTAHVWFARPGMGKSAVLVQISDLVSEMGFNVLVFSLEMNKEQWIRRLILRRSKISFDKFKAGTLTDDEWQRFTEESSSVHERMNLWVDDSTVLTSQEMMVKAELLAREHGLDLIIGDHLRLHADKGDNQVNRLGKISWAYKQIARRLDCVSIFAAQINRGVEGREDKRPDLNDLRDSGEIEENVDGARALYRKAYYSDDPASADKTIEIWNRKDREGARNDKSEMIFIPEYMSLERKQFDPLANVKAQSRNGNGRHVDLVNA